jgi:UDP-N-acetylmuramate--alanine ligase
MSALARYFVAKNFEVAGYDRDQSEICISLTNDSCEISYEDDLATIPASFRDKKNTLVVYTPAIPKNNKLIKYFQDEDYLLCKRAEILGAITKNVQCLAIAGTHGKTTISSLLSYILSDNLVDCSAFLGGIATDFDSNLRIGSADIAVVEADEFDRSFLKLSPNWALISSMDADHLDIYGTARHLEESFRLFSDKVEDGNLIVKEGLNVPSKYTYALDSDTADFSATKIRVEDGAYYFDLIYPKGVCRNVITGLPGIHNVENALAAFAMAYFQGLSTSGIVDSIASFSGVKRRFEYHVKTDHQIYIDDYAHHPTEIEVAIRSVRDLFPNKELTVIFQPHLFTRTRDFMDDFARELSAADQVMLLDIYPARELPIEGVNSEVLLDKITCKQKGVYAKSKFPEVIAKTDVLMTMGAGDIDGLIEPIKKYLAS